MKGTVTIKRVYPPKKNPEGVTKYKYAFEDSEGFQGVAFADEKPKKDNQMAVISLRNYKGKWYAKHIEFLTFAEEK